MYKKYYISIKKEIIDWDIGEDEGLCEKDADEIISVLEENSDAMK